MSDAAAPVPAAEPPIAPVSAVVGTFSSPSETFRRLVARPTWWLPFLLSLVLGTLTYAVASPKIDLEATIRASLEKSGRSVPAGAVERQVAFMQKWSAVVTAGVFVVGSGAFFFVALILWGAAKMMGADARYSQLLAIWAHSGLPSAIGSLVAIPLFLRLPDGSLTQTAAENIVASNVGAFLDDSTPAALRTLGSSIDIFSFAVLFLLVIGFRRLPGLSTGTATAIPIVLWLLFVVGKVAWRAVMG
ncbi:MAG: YIP1 family protein [Thermoanaerobaculia bacterium]|nr:YIP1 family protein [Thermoanaerobaculia bacterium]